MQASAAEERIKSQRLTFMLEKRRKELSKKQADERERVARRERESYDDTLDSLMLQSNEYNSTEEISIASMDSSVSEEVVEIDQEKVNADKMLAAMRAQKDETVSLARYLTNLSKINRGIGDVTELNGATIKTAMILVELEHPRRVAPNARSLIESVMTMTGSNGEDFCIGGWAEYRGPDMKWHLDVVYKVLPMSEESNEVFYNVGPRRRLRRYEVRKPQEGLIRIFGYRPWIWQQWAMLKVEQQLRFQQGNHHDFERFNVPLYARDLWFEWMNSPENEDFRKHLCDPRISHCQDDLFDHIMKPFYLLDDIRREDGWDFNCGEVSIFTYWGLLGSGFSMCIVCILLQIFIPAVLLINTLSELKEDGLIPGGTDENLSMWDTFTNLFCVSGKARCNLREMTTLIIFCVQVLYLIQVVPDSEVAFRNVIGVGGFGTDNSFARIKALRLIVTNRNNDRMSQAFGNIWDFYMNTLYVYFLFMLNIFNILNQASPTDVVLNALALEFVNKIDEEYAKSVWWDPNKRWLKAGVMEVVMQGVLRFRVIRSARLFADTYGVTEEEVLLACDDDTNLLYNVSLSCNDNDDVDFKDDSELFEHFCMKTSMKETKTEEVKYEFQKRQRVFGAPDQKFFQLFKYAASAVKLKPLETLCIFDRHGGYRTWSRWKMVLFIPAVPKLDDLFEDNADGVPIVKKVLEKVKHKAETPFYNFSTDASLVDPQKALRKRQRKVLSFQAYRGYIRRNLYEREYHRCIFWLFNGFFEWFAFIVQVGFPLYNIGLVLLVPSCWSIIQEKKNQPWVDSKACHCKVMDLPRCIESVLRADSLHGIANAEINCALIEDEIREEDYNFSAAIIKIGSNFRMNLKQNQNVSALMGALDEQVRNDIMNDCIFDSIGTVEV